eukprot:3904337-Amphidinium_carterae.1
MAECVMKLCSGKFRTLFTASCLEQESFTWSLTFRRSDAWTCEGTGKQLPRPEVTAALYNCITSRNQHSDDYFYPVFEIQSVHGSSFKKHVVKTFNIFFHRFKVHVRTFQSLARKPRSTSLGSAAESRQKCMAPTASIKVTASRPSQLAQWDTLAAFRRDGSF